MHFLKFPSAFFNNADSRIFSFLSFFTPLVVRVLPEVLMGRYIVGFDTISYYVPVTLKWVNDGVGFFEFMAPAPLFYALLTQLTLIGVPLTVSLKVLPPILHGFLGLAIYFYAKKVLTWSSRDSLFVSCLTALYFVTLRFSWDMLRAELGLIFLFVFLIVLHGGWENNRWKHYGSLLSLTVLVVLSHQLVAVIMFVIVSVFVLQGLLSRKYGAAKNLVLCSLPALVLFGLIVYADFAVFPGEDSSGWFSLFGFSSYSGIVANTVGFLFYCYLPLLPFVLVGIRGFKNLELKLWFYLCLVAVLLSFIAPYALFPLGYRWVLLLVFPMAFFVVEGFKRFSRFWRMLLGGILVFLSFSFVFLPAEMAFPYFCVFPYYVPSSMLQNSVPLRDCEDVVKALSWIGDNIGSDEVLLVHDAFHGWALLFLDRIRVVCYGYENPEEVACDISKNGYSRLYLVWWVSGEGWHGLASLPPCFVEIFRSNRIAVYVYDASSGFR